MCIYRNTFHDRLFSAYEAGLSPFLMKISYPPSPPPPPLSLSLSLSLFLSLSFSLSLSLRATQFCRSSMRMVTGSFPLLNSSRYCTGLSCALEKEKGCVCVCGRGADQAGVPFMQGTLVSAYACVCVCQCVCMCVCRVRVCSICMCVCVCMCVGVCARMLGMGIRA